MDAKGGKRALAFPAPVLRRGVAGRLLTMLSDLDLLYTANDERRTRRRESQIGPWPSAVLQRNPKFASRETRIGNESICSMRPCRFQCCATFNHSASFRIRFLKSAGLSGLESLP
jgi:hypothetical protein